MDGVIGEADKEGKGDEVRARIEAFKRESSIKAYSVIGVFIAATIYFKMTYEGP